MENETRCCVDITIVSTGDILTGQFYYLSRIRFSDAIGWPNVPALMIQGCMAEPIDWSRAVGTVPRRVVLNREQLVFAIPQNESMPRPTLADEYLKKQPRQVEIAAAGWTITGEIYVAEGVLPGDVLSSGLRDFFPVTSAVAIYRGVRQREIRADLMVLNRKHVSLFWLDN